MKKSCYCSLDLIPRAPHFLTEVRFEIAIKIFEFNPLKARLAV